MLNALNKVLAKRLEFIDPAGKGLDLQKEVEELKKEAFSGDIAENIDDRMIREVLEKAMVSDGDFFTHTRRSYDMM